MRTAACYSKLVTVAFCLGSEGGNETAAAWDERISPAGKETVAGGEVAEGVEALESQHDRVASQNESMDSDYYGDCNGKNMRTVRLTKTIGLAV